MKNYRILVGALAALAMTACSDDKGDSPKNPGETTDVFLKVNILSPNSDVISGRATTDSDFSEGTTDENEIQNITLVFYDSRGNYLTSKPVSKSSGFTDATNSESPNVAVVKTVKAAISVQDGKYPSYMMAFVNPVDNSNISTSLSEIATQTRTGYKGSNQNFAMNNSAYYDNGGIFYRAVPVSKDNFFVNEDDESTAVDVYVERLAAKVILKGTSTSETSLGTQEGELNGKQLKFTVTGWGLNAEARSMYLCKNLGTSFSSMTSAMGTGNTPSDVWWNDPTRHRSYWAVSPFYTKPSETDNIKNNQYQFPFVSDQANGLTTLKYNKWSDMNKVIGTSTYTLENTMEAAFYNANSFQNSSLISAIVAGYYTVDGEQKDFYVQGENIYLEEEYLLAMAKLGAVIVKSDGSPVYNDADKSSLKEIFQIHHPQTPAIGDNTRGVEENKVTIQFKGDRSQYKYKLGNAAPVDITDANIDEINDRLYSNCGLSSMYKDGKAYFNVPIRHLASEPTGENAALPLGYYGVVRNHVYEISVSGFANLSFETMGEGVRNPEDPIVPPTDPSGEIKINASVKALAWRMVKQTVTLGQ